MPIPGNAEPGAFSGLQQVQQQQSINAMPIKKRRFPIIRPSSPPLEEKRSNSEGHDSKNKQESNVPDESVERKASSPGNPDISKMPALAVKKEVTPENIELGQANVGISSSKLPEAKYNVSLDPKDELRNKTDIFPNVKCSVSEVPESCISAQATSVKQEIVSGQTEVSTGSMNVELSLGPKEPLVPGLVHQNSEAICSTSEKSDPSLLSLALSEEKLVLHDKNGTGTDNVSSQGCANRSNWDLNTTMDVWEGSTNSDSFAHRLVDIGGFKKNNSCQDEKSCVTTAGTVGLSYNKGKHILYYQRSDSSNSSTQPIQHCKNDDSLGLRLAMPYRESERSSISVNLVSTSVSPNLNLQQVHLTAMNVNKAVKSEPVDENSKRDCSIGSCSSTNMGLPKFSSVKRELVNNHSMETLLQSSNTPEKLVDHRLIKSEVVQVGNQEGRKSENAVLHQSVARVMQNPESSASSSATPVPLLTQNPCSSRLSTYSELTTSGDLSNQSEHSFHNKESYDQNEIPDERIAGRVSTSGSQDDKQLKLSKVGNSSNVVPDKCKLARVDEHTTESCQLGANDEEKINISTEMLEEDSFGSDCETQENRGVDISMDMGENVCGKEDEEYEDGEVRETLQHSAGEDPVDEGKKTENLKLTVCDSENLPNSVLLGDQSINNSDSGGKDAAKEKHDETRENPNNECASVSNERISEDTSLQKLSEKVLEVGVEKRSITVTPDKQLDLSGRKDVEESPVKEVSSGGPANGSHGIGSELGEEVANKVVKEVCPADKDPALTKMETSFIGHDAAKDPNNIGNKSRIINLSRPSVATSPCKTRSIPNRLLTSRSGKERYSDPDGEIQSRGNREEFYSGGPNKFAKDRAHDQSLRSSRPSFMFGKGRISGRFGSLRGEWDSDHNFASEASYGQSDYPVRRKHASIRDVELECNGYGIPQDVAALGGNRRKAMNDEFPSLHHTSLRRLSPGDRDGPVTRGMQMLRRIPRNMSPNRCTVEDGSDLMGGRHGDKFMRHLSDDIIDPVYSRPQAMYDELDSQHVRGNRNFSTLPRKGYNHQIRSKSPVRSRTRSPGPWSSPRRRSPNGPQELTQHRSPGLYRMGRVRSPERACFRDEMVARRRGSPSYVARHPNDFRDVDSGREHVHPRSANSNRRSSPTRVFPRNTRRANALDSREMGDGDEYIDGPLHSNKFHELRGEGSIDERRKFSERGGGPLRSFRPNYGNDNDNFRFHLNDGPRPYRFCPDADTEFVERSNMRERDFDGRIKNQSLVLSRRIRNIEEQQDGNYRPVERVWHDDGFTDARLKRRRF